MQSGFECWPDCCSRSQHFIEAGLHDMSFPSGAGVAVPGGIPGLLVWRLRPAGCGFQRVWNPPGAGFNAFGTLRVWVSNCLKPVGSGFQTKWPVFGGLPGYPGYPGSRVRALSCWQRKSCTETARLRRFGKSGVLFRAGLALGAKCSQTSTATGFWTQSKVLMKALTL